MDTFQLLSGWLKELAFLLLTGAGRVKNENVSNVEDMENMFENARSFNQPLHAPWYHEDSESE